MSRYIFLVPSLIVFLSLAACSDARKDPCQLLTVADVKSVDNTVADSIWAGRDGEMKDDEVCMFHTGDGEPRVMLFVWYDSESDPWELASKGVAGTGATIVDLSGIGTEAAAAFSDDELKLLAVKSSRGLVGLRVRKTASRDSADFNEIVQLAEEALARK